jgi:hypothetical protein
VNQPIRQSLSRTVSLTLGVAVLVASGCGGTRATSLKQSDDVERSQPVAVVRRADPEPPAAETSVDGRGVNAGRPPEWLRGVPDQYPRSRYITGVGTGRSREESTTRARAEVAKFFKVTVEVEERVAESESTGDGATSQSQSLSSRVRSAAEGEVEGADIAEVYAAPDGTYSALAVLPIEEAARILDERIAALAREIEAGLQQPPQGPIGYEPLRTLVLARVALRKSGKLLEKRRVLNLPAKPTVASDPSTARELSARFARQPVTLEVVGVNASRYRTSLAAAVTATGMVVAPTDRGAAAKAAAGAGADAAAHITVRSKYAPSTRGDPRWKHLEGDVVVVMTDESGRVRSNDRLTCRRSGLDERQALEKLIDCMADSLEHAWPADLIADMGQDHEGDPQADGAARN